MRKRMLSTGAIVAIVLGAIFVVALPIIAVFATLIGSAVFEMKEKGNATACLSNLKNLGIALTDYKYIYRKYPFDPYKSDTFNGKNHHEYMIMLRRFHTSSNPKLYICPSASGVEVAEDIAIKDVTDSDFEATNNSYAYFMGKTDSGARSTQMMPSSGILSDGWRGGTDINSTEDVGWNHESVGNFVRVDGSANQAEGAFWPNEVKGNDAAANDWKTFALE